MLLQTGEFVAFFAGGLPVGLVIDVGSGDEDRHILVRLVDDPITESLRDPLKMRVLDVVLRDNIKSQVLQLHETHCLIYILLAEGPRDE